MPGTAAAISAVPLNAYDTVFSMFDWPVHKYLRTSVAPAAARGRYWTKAQGEMQREWVCLTTNGSAYTSPNTTSFATTGIPPLLPVSVSV